MKYQFENNDAFSYEQLLRYAKENRKNPTEAESLLWQYLAHEQMGVHFRFQHPICGYVPDFVCLSRKVIIEIDGGFHLTDEQSMMGVERTHYLEQEGYRVLKFTKDEVLGNLDGVLDKICDTLEKIAENVPQLHSNPVSQVLSSDDETNIILGSEDKDSCPSTQKDSGLGIRIGLGYDVHRLVEGRELWLGGVLIPHDRGLLGHSDADVLIHAICDALLGAANMRDIGYHFPDTSAETLNIDSKILLRKTIELIATKGYRLMNIDATVCAEHPKINPHVPAMKACLAEIMGTDEDNISIKATTTEQLGFTGREEGISAYAVCMIEK